MAVLLPGFDAGVADVGDERTAPSLGGDEHPLTAPSSATDPVSQ